VVNRSGSRADRGDDDAVNTFRVSAGQLHFCIGFDSRQLHNKSHWSIACLDSRDSCGSLGSAKALEIHPASGKQIVNAAL
jgi:hypothetical protein